jgi:hypothetical protein
MTQEETRDDTRGKMTQKKEVEQKGVLAILRLSLGAGVTPAAEA